MPHFPIDITALNETTFSAGQVIIHESIRSDRVYVLKSGCVRISAEGREICTIREPLTIFGEISVLLDRAHTATVTVIEDSTFYVIDDLLAYAREHPEAMLHAAEVLAQRVVNMTEAFIELKQAAEKMPAMLKNSRVMQLILRIDEFWGRDVL